MLLQISFIGLLLSSSALAAPIENINREVDPVSTRCVNYLTQRGNNLGHDYSQLIVIRSNGLTKRSENLFILNQGPGLEDGGFDSDPEDDDLDQWFLPEEQGQQAQNNNQPFNVAPYAMSWATTAENLERHLWVQVDAKIPSHANLELHPLGGETI